MSSTYIWCNPCCLDLQEKHRNAPKITKKSNSFDSIQLLNRNTQKLKTRLSRWTRLSATEPFVVIRNSFVQYLRCSSPNNKTTSKWCRFWGGFDVFGSAVAVYYSPKSGYPSAEAPYFDFELRALVAAATQVEIESQSSFVDIQNLVLNH